MLGWSAAVGLLVAGCSDPCGFRLSTRDRCERLCKQVANRIEECMDESMTWSDLGARSHDDFTRSCRQDWSGVTADLSSNELELALDDCQASCVDLEAMSCDEVVALYAP